MSEINVEQLKKDIKEEIVKSKLLASLRSNDEIYLSEILKTIKNRWKFITIFTGLFAIVALVYSISLPNYYESSSSVYIENINTGSDNIRPLNADIVAASLNSEITKNFIINKFGIATNSAILGKAANSETPIKYDELLKIVDKSISVGFNANVISVTAETMDANLSAEIVAAYIDRLAFLVSEPINSKLDLLKKQLENVERELRTSEDNYKKFIEDNNIDSLEIASNTPVIALQIGKYSREISVKEKLFEDISLQYKKGSLEFSDVSSLYKVIERPRVSTLKSKPSRAKIIIYATLIGFALSIYFVIMKMVIYKK